MFDLFSGLSLLMGSVLFVSVLFVLAFEFINGFHDTANAVATVIYTQSMKPRMAVVLSGLFNFVGVFAGGLAVAYAIVHLLPVEVLISSNSFLGLSLVFSLLAAAIIWNIGTWYFGIPASSSHTLIGSILGVGIANSLIFHNSWSYGVNWKKATDIGISLFVSPLVGFGVAALMIFIFLKYRPKSHSHQTPSQRIVVDGKTKPPFWTRMVLILSAMGVSFAHGSNDGQKGVGLLMLVLIGIVPAKVVLNLNSNPYDIQETKTAIERFEAFYQKNQVTLMAVSPVTAATKSCVHTDSVQKAQNIQALLNNTKSYQELNDKQRISMRNDLLCLDDTAKQIQKLPNLSASDQDYLKKLRSDINKPIEYAPFWTIVAIALALGLGTMVGWKRVVKTVGEGIGKKEMTYAQGAAAQLTTAIAVGLASFAGLPVSTTQVLSSSVAGAVINGGIQTSTVKKIFLTWIVTLPSTMLLAGGLFYLSTLFFV